MSFSCLGSSGSRMTVYMLDERRLTLVNHSLMTHGRRLVLLLVPAPFRFRHWSEFLATVRAPLRMAFGGRALQSDAQFRP